MSVYYICFLDGQARVLAEGNVIKEGNFKEVILTYKQFEMYKQKTINLDNNLNLHY